MYQVLFAPEAEAQLVSLYQYIASAASPEIAQNYTLDLVAHCESFTTFPLRGTLREDVRPNLRIAGYKRRVTIAFDVSEDIVTILGVFYGGQDFETSLHE